MARKKKSRILWGRLIALCLAVVLVAGGAVFGLVKLFSAVLNGGNTGEITVSEISSQTEDDEPRNEYTETWNLKLVNADNPIEEGYDIPLDTVDFRYASSNMVQMDSRAVENFEQMCKDAAEEGLSLFAASAYRSVELQEKLFQREIESNLSENPGMTEQEAEELAATVIAIPGTSEHNLGLAVDINTDTEEFKYTDEYAWLCEHAAEYGFVERYPEDKTEITGIIYEPWHYRYVGAEDAAKMVELDMCLEEYVEYLKAGGE